MDSREQIIEKAEELFRLYGVKSITMDEMAREMGMSKKTLYHYFKDKDEIVKEATLRILNHDRNEFEIIEKQAANVIEELFLLSKCLRQNFENLNPSILFDLKRYHPDSWHLFLDFKENFFKETLRTTLKEGVEQGFFRSEIDIEILTTLRLEEVQMSFDPRVFPRDKFNFKEVQMQFFDHFINGIMTEKGRKYYYELFQMETIQK